MTSLILRRHTYGCLMHIGQANDHLGPVSDYFVLAHDHLHIITLTDMIMNVVGLMQTESLSGDGWLFELYSINNILSQEERVFWYVDLTRSTSLI